LILLVFFLKNEKISLIGLVVKEVIAVVVAQVEVTQIALVVAQVGVVQVDMNLDLLDLMQALKTRTVQTR
jgi:uncharacterized membrane protein (Fun14 family)